MKWFKSKCDHSVCERCGNVFDPNGVEKRWADMCYSCRVPAMEKDRRKDVVISWAIANWEKLEPQALEENEAQREAYQNSLNAFSKYNQANNTLTNN